MMNVNVGDQVVRFLSRWSSEGYTTGTVVAVTATQFTAEFGSKKVRFNKRDGSEIGNRHAMLVDVVGERQRQRMADIDRLKDARSAVQKAANAAGYATDSTSSKSMAVVGAKDDASLAKLKELCAKMEALAAEFLAFRGEG